MARISNQAIRSLMNQWVMWWSWSKLSKTTIISAIGFLFIVILSPLIVWFPLNILYFALCVFRFNYTNTHDSITWEKVVKWIKDEDLKALEAKSCLRKWLIVLFLAFFLFPRVSNTYWIVAYILPILALIIWYPLWMYKKENWIKSREKIAIIILLVLFRIVILWTIKIWAQ